ncbi:MAG UNVERIFIED_CONTAM: hypothetical protein LVR18_50775 [Planctomycetaceae bacterium]
MLPRWSGLTAVEYFVCLSRLGRCCDWWSCRWLDRRLNGPNGEFENGRPTLRLDDLVTLSRTFSPGGRGFLMCTIDPKADQVKAVKDFASRTQLTAGNVRRFTQQVEEMLGCRASPYLAYRMTREWPV